MSGTTITLRPMDQDEYDDYANRGNDEYAQSLARTMPIEAARVKARQDRAQFLPEGLATEGQHLLVAENAAGEAVGIAWLGLAEPRSGSRETAWLFDIKVADAHRRAGYGRAILAAVEELAKRAGAERLGLNVFAHNQPAISLYEKAGYQVTDQRMAKRLA